MGRRAAGIDRARGRYDRGDNSEGLGGGRADVAEGSSRGLLTMCAGVGRPANQTTPRPFSMPPRRYLWVVWRVFRVYGAASDRLFRDPASIGFCVCCCGCGHVGNALALSTCPQPFSRPAHRGLNNKAKPTTRKSYGFRPFHVTEVAKYHTLGKLPEPATTHRFRRRPFSICSPECQMQGL
jgi:hypothetical protein